MILKEKTDHHEIPEISGHDTTTQKIISFLSCIRDEQKLQRIYRLVKYIYFSS